MSDLLDDGIIFFNDSRYFEAHEVWEDLWRDDRGSQRLFYQGLIQAAVGLYHLTRSNQTGARNQIRKSLLKLDDYADDTADIDVGRLKQDLRKVLAQMEIGPDGVRIVRLKRDRVVVESQGTV